MVPIDILNTNFVLDLTGKEEHFNYVREIVCDEIEKNQSYYEPYISTDFYLHVQSMRKNKGGSEITLIS
jgi:hypothetical protein